MCVSPVSASVVDSVPTGALAPPDWLTDVAVKPMSVGVSFTPVMFTVKVAVPVAALAFWSVAVTVNVSLVLAKRPLMAEALGTYTYEPSLLLTYSVP